MLSAREFYGLQKMKKQGKLANNPRAAALLDKVTDNLNTISQKSTKDVEKVIRPSLTTHSESPKENTKNKQKKKRKRKSSEEKNLAETTKPTSQLPTSVDINDSNAMKNLSKSQRKKIRKKLKNQNNQQQQPSKQQQPNHQVSSSVAQPLTAGTKRQHPTPVSPSTEAVFPPRKKQCISQTTVNIDKPTSHSGTAPSAAKETAKSSFIPLDPITLGRKELEKILAPISIIDFFGKYFEKQPLLIQRKGKFENQWLTTQEIDFLLRSERVMFTEHLDLAAYEDGERYTLNPDGRAFAPLVWDHYNTGCSVRLLCPQVFFPTIRQRLSLLQEYFGCFVGANVYLTPPKSQGFAPHYDDIEAFVLQLEGNKRWRVYAPRDESEQLARDSSPNFQQSEVGEPILTATLKPGDVLYFPRGFIHQADTQDDSHSLHLTISTYQKHSWGDFLTKLLPIALQSAIETDVDFRRGLPVGFLRHVGGFSKQKEQSNEAVECLNKVRRETVARLRKLADRLEAKLPATAAPDPLLTAADLFATDLIAQSLPPQLLDEEAICHIEAQGERWSSGETWKQDTSSDTPKVAGVTNVVELEPDTKIRLVRWSAVRAVRTRVANAGDTQTSAMNETASENGSDNEEDTKDLIALYHSLSNTNIYEERPLDELALQRRFLPAIDYLATHYPNFVKINDLPLEQLEDRMEVAVGLYEGGLLLTSEPLESIDDEDEGSDHSESQSDDQAIDDDASQGLSTLIETTMEDDETEDDEPTDSDDLDPDELTNFVDDEDDSSVEENVDLDFSEEEEDDSSDSPIQTNVKHKLAALPAPPNKQKPKHKKKK